MCKLICTSAFAFSLMLSSVCFAHGGGGGWHGGGGGWHGGGGGWHGGGWHGGGWNGAGWGTGVVIGVPYGGYYDSDCQTIRVCNAHGRCWLQNSCY